ncbi:MAG: addiction module protein [Lewinellaceae bacterium]|nr:addiction module protein [Saprospiraceae bacterium]MCB9337370.1 addiction module protein [Lewinellaceae bacterium]
MSRSQLIEKIDLLPLTLQHEVSDFVEFLLNKHFKGNPSPADEPELTEEQKAELDRRYQEYLDNPDSTISIEELKNRLMKKYSLHNPD